MIIFKIYFQSKSCLAGPFTLRKTQEFEYASYFHLSIHLTNIAEYLPCQENVKFLKYTGEDKISVCTHGT